MTMSPALETQLTARFRDAFGAEPTALVRAPGRVNLIGDHTDYHGLPVFPMAIQRGIRIAIRPRSDNQVRLHNLELGFGPVTFELASEIPPEPAGSWGNYPRAAARAVAARGTVLRGFDGMVGSDLPRAAGLSSSSALVVATALSLLHANGAGIPVVELAALLARGERDVGTEGGGMDQAISLAGIRGHAARIDFDPLRLEQIPVPGHWAFVVAQSLVGAEKSGSAREIYNLRVRESGDGLAAGEAATGVLARRRRHVLSEAERVGQAVEAMRRDDLAGFGALMTASHASLRDDYEVSTPALEALVQLALEQGAHGARLTGAGLGGCMVALVSRERAAAMVHGLFEEFHAARGVSPEDQPGCVFVAEPCTGAELTGR